MQGRDRPPALKELLPAVGKLSIPESCLQLCINGYRIDCSTPPKLDTRQVIRPFGWLSHASFKGARSQPTSSYLSVADRWRKLDASKRLRERRHKSRNGKGQPYRPNGAVLRGGRLISSRKRGADQPRKPSFLGASLARRPLRGGCG